MTSWQSHKIADSEKSTEDKPDDATSAESEDTAVDVTNRIPVICSQRADSIQVDFTDSLQDICDIDLESSANANGASGQIYLPPAAFDLSTGTTFSNIGCQNCSQFASRRCNECVAYAYSDYHPDNFHDPLPTVDDSDCADKQYYITVLSSVNNDPTVRSEAEINVPDYNGQIIEQHDAFFESNSQSLRNWNRNLCNQIAIEQNTRMYDDAELCANDSDNEDDIHHNNISKMFSTMEYYPNDSSDDECSAKFSDDDGAEYSAVVTNGVCQVPLATFGSAYSSFRTERPFSKSSYCCDDNSDWKKPQYDEFYCGMHESFDRIKDDEAHSVVGGSDGEHDGLNNENASATTESDQATQCNEDTASTHLVDDEAEHDRPFVSHTVHQTQGPSDVIPVVAAQNFQSDISALRFQRNDQNPLLPHPRQVSSTVREANWRNLGTGGAASYQCRSERHQSPDLSSLGSDMTLSVHSRSMASAVDESIAWPRPCRTNFRGTF